MLCFWLATLKGKLNHIHRCRLRCHRFRSFFGKKNTRKANKQLAKKTKAATTGGWTSKSRTELRYSRYMTINNAIATRDLPTHGWKNINSAGAKPHGLVGSEVIRRRQPDLYYCRLSYIERHFPQAHEFGHAHQNVPLFPSRCQRPQQRRQASELIRIGLRSS